MNIIGQSFGRYHILEKLGEGGMATVYKAYDTRLERDVAIKVIRVDQFSPATLQSVLARFEREAKSLARLTHPNIVHISDYGEQDNVPYLVMDYLPGGTLKSRLGQPMKWQATCKLLLPIAQALDYAHEQNLIHRDVKPANILMTQKGQPMLTDFGIAKILDAGGQTLTATGVGIGTPDYMAPEQWTGKTTPQSDIYSLGVVMYEMVTGRTPFSSDTPAAILLKQATEPLPRPMQYVQDLPEAVEKVLIKALAREPADRYQTMDDFARALEGLLVGVMTEEPAKPTLEAFAAILTSTETLPPPESEKSVDLKTIAVIEDKKAATETVIDSPTSTQTAQYSHPTSSSTVKTKRRWSLKRSYIIGGLIVLISLVLLAAGSRAVVWGTKGFGPLAGLAPEISNKPVMPISTWGRSADGMVMVYVPEGDFLMGSDPAKDKDALSSEQPQHSVYLDAYLIDQTEVTNAMFAVFLNEQGKAQYWDTDVSGIKRTGNTWVVDSGDENRPFGNAYWIGAQAYCEWAGARLPTEAEWEKAARGTDGRTYPWGNVHPTCDLSNGRFKEDFWGNTDYCVGTTRPVGSYPLGASPYGAYDMAGNVDEWVADWFDVYYYNTSPSSNPTGPSTGDYRVVRGGDWFSGVEQLVRVSRRDFSDPTSDYSSGGFRCARGVTAVTPSPTPTATKVVTPTSKPGNGSIFFDEFNSNTNGWVVGTFTDDSGTFTYTMNGSYKWEFVIKKGQFRRVWAKQAPIVEDFTVSVDATHVSGSENASYGIVFRGKDNNNFYNFLINKDYYFIGLLKDGKWTTLVDWKNTTKINANALNQLKVIGKGDEFTFYINDQKIDQVKDGSLPKGTAGLVVELYNAGDTSTFEFDNFTLKNP
jgi:eukaryotic-like serine/threonine-protein kinase